jgi:hypothetical protein
MDVAMWVTALNSGFWLRKPMLVPERWKLVSISWRDAKVE